MKVFISSVITGFETYRAAAAKAVITLGDEVIQAEDFGASVGSPQQTCLDGVREADLTILLLGERYGAKQASGLSATHEEYREARERGLVLAFIQDAVEYESDQRKFIDEVHEWATGNLTTGFRSEDDLRDAVTRELHAYAVAAAANPLDETELLARAKEQLPRGGFFRRDAELVLSLASGPTQEVLRPSELEDRALARNLQQQALFGARAPFDPARATDFDFQSGWLILSQGTTRIEIDATGGIIIRQPALAAVDRDFGLQVLVEEDIRERLASALTFAASVLDQVDSRRRLSYAAIVAALTGVEYQTWRTQLEHARSPNATSPNVRRDRAEVHLSSGVHARSGIAQRADAIATDLTVLLRRELTR